MKNFIKIYIAFLFISCVSAQDAVKKDDRKKMYRISRVETKNNWFIIYAEKQDSIFKIISGKEPYLNGDCKKIKVGKSYSFELKPRRGNAPEIGGVKLNPVNYLDIECFSYDAYTEICIEPKKGIYDLYYTYNLKGLCYIE